MLDLLLILTILIANSLYIFGLWYSTQDGMINAWVDRLLKNKPEWVKMPVYDCPICMASFHSYLFPLVILVFGFSFTMLWVWPFYIVILAGINGIILNLTKAPENGIIGKDVMIEVESYGLLQVVIIDKVGSQYLAENNNCTFTVNPANIKAIL